MPGSAGAAAPCACLPVDHATLIELYDSRPDVDTPDALQLGSRELCVSAQASQPAGADKTPQQRSASTLGAAGHQAPPSAPSKAGHSRAVSAAASTEPLVSTLSHHAGCHSRMHQARQTPPTFPSKAGHGDDAVRSDVYGAVSEIFALG